MEGWKSSIIDSLRLLGHALVGPPRPRRLLSRGRRHYAEHMPELPEVEAWVRELSPLVARSPVASARPGPHRDAEELRPAAGRARGADVLGLGAARQEPALPDRRRRARAPRAPDERGPPPVRRAGQEGAGEADVPRRVRRRRRARADGGAARRSARASGSSRRRRSTPSSPTSARTRSTSTRARSARSCGRSAASSTRCSATSARSRASAAPTRTRCSGKRACRRSASRPSSRTRRSSGSRPRSTTTSRARSSCGSQGKGDDAVYRVHGHYGEPCPRCGDTLRPGRLRGAHDHVLRRVPDRWPDPQGPASLPAPALTRAGGAARTLYRAPMSDLPLVGDLQASAPPIWLALSRVGVTGVHKALRIRRGAQEILMAAELECTVDLARDQKGVHMSRFPELFDEAIDDVVLGEGLLVENLADRIATQIVERQRALRAEVRIVARWPLRRRTPVTGLDDPGDGLPDRDRGRDGRRLAARRRGRGDGDQRVPVRAGARPRHGRPSASPRRASATTSSGSWSSSRSRRTTSAVAGHCSSGRRASSTPRTSWGSSSAR